MCGICGSVNFDGDYLLSQADLITFSEPLKYRGPDSEGYLLTKNGNASVSFAHKRLSIIDLTDAANQPMNSVSGKTLITFNGEIYNYKSLKIDLQKEGINFKTNSDTEVILNGFEFWGIDLLLEKIDGMFSFALFSYETNDLYLCRDRFGKKPLYYISQNQKVYFSSDIRSFNSIAINKTLNLHSLGYFFYEMSTPRKDTIWNEVKKIPEAHYLKISESGVSLKKHWELDGQSINLDRQDVIMNTENLLIEAVKKRMVSDVNVSVMLSGGVDSSIVAAIMAELSSDRISTYSVGSESLKFNELPYAKQVANKYNTDHTELVISTDDFSQLDGLIEEYGEPFADPSMLPTYLISNEISKFEKVALTGDGGDEIFGGYYEYYLTHKLSQVKWMSKLYPLVNRLSSYTSNYKVNFLHLLLKNSKSPDYQLLNRNYVFNSEELTQIFGPENLIIDSMNKEHQSVYEEFANSNFLLKKILSSSHHTRLVNDYLVKIDRASMYASLELRSPFLDKDLARFTNSLQPNQLFYKNEPKSILKKVALNYLPEDLIYRKKMGFGIPLDKWFRKDLKKEIQDVVLGGKQNLIPMNYTIIEDLLNTFFQNNDADVRKVWTLFSFHKWCQLNKF